MFLLSASAAKQGDCQSSSRRSMLEFACSENDHNAPKHVLIASFETGKVRCCEGSCSDFGNGAGAGCRIKVSGCFCEVFCSILTLFFMSSRDDTPLENVGGIFGTSLNCSLCRIRNCVTDVLFLPEEKHEV